MAGRRPTACDAHLPHHDQLRRFAGFQSPTALLTANFTRSCCQALTLPRPHRSASAAPPLTAPLPSTCSDEGVGQGRGREAFPTLSHDRAPHATSVQVSGGAAEAANWHEAPSPPPSKLIDPTRGPVAIRFVAMQRAIT